MEGRSPPSQHLGFWYFYYRHPTFLQPVPSHLVVPGWGSCSEPTGSPLPLLSGSLNTVRALCYPTQAPCPYYYLLICDPTFFLALSPPSRFISLAYPFPKSLGSPHHTLARMVPLSEHLGLCYKGLGTLAKLSRGGKPWISRKPKISNHVD